MHSYPHELSGGLLQRATIATALSCEPELVIADEPTTALDALVQTQVVDSFMRLVRELGTSVIVITHDLRLLERMADRIAVMYAGRIVEFGPAERLLHAPRHRYPAALLESSVRSCRARADVSTRWRASHRGCRARSSPARSLRAARSPTSAAASEEPEYAWPADGGRRLPSPPGRADMIGPALAPTRPREPQAWGLRVGLGLLFAILVAVVVLGPLLWDVDPTFESFASLTESGEPLDAGAEGHPLGTDRRVATCSRGCFYAGRLTLLTALVSVGIATVAGLLVGLLASNDRRFLGSVLMRFTDFGLAIPGLLLAAAISTILGRGTLSLIIGLAAVFWAPIARVTYGQAVVLREREYVEAARVQGGGAIDGAGAPHPAAPAAGGGRIRGPVGGLGCALRSVPGLPRRRRPGTRRIDRLDAGSTTSTTTAATPDSSSSRRSSWACW